MPATQPTESNDLARVGADDTGITEQEGPHQGNPSHAPKKEWPSSAKEELDRFKGIPVVGSLPWRTQYLVLAAVLALSVLSLLGLMATSRNAGVNPGVSNQAREAVRQVSTQVDVLSQGGVVDAAALVKAQEQGNSASRALGLSSEWERVSAALAGVSSLAETSRSFRQNAESARLALMQGVSKAQPLLNQAKNDGSAFSAEGLALAQTIGLYQTLATGLEDPGFTSEEQASIATLSTEILNAFAAFRQSQWATQDVALTRAWRELSATWAVVSPALEQSAGTMAKLQPLERNIASTKTALASFSQSVDNRMPGSSSGNSALLWFVGLVGLVSLGLLLWVAWKQHRWQILNIQAVGEQNEQAVLEMMEDLELIGNGDLTRRARVSESAIGTLADTINKTVDQLRRMIQMAKKTTAETLVASLRANEKVGLLIDGQRERLSVLEVNSQDLLRLIEAVSAGAHEAAVASGLAEQAQTTAISGHGAVSQSLDKMREARVRVDEALSRTQRLVASSNEIAGMALTLKEIAEQLEILGMQAAMQAAKAGDAGQGFKVVAKNVQDLASASEKRARNVSVLVETALSDLEALSASMSGASVMVEEGTGLTDMSYEAWQNVNEQLESLLGRVRSLRQKSNEQEQLAELLDKRTRNDLNQMAAAAVQTQEASDSIGHMYGSVQAVDQTVSRFKA